MMQRAAYLLIGAGALVLIGWSVKGFFLSDQIPILVRVAVGAVAIGALILVGLVVKDRLSESRDDDFKEVQR
jgi:tetrahydromethanopterin S-methyltransferase subunit C